MSTIWVKLKANWPGTFRRPVRDGNGNVLRTLTFNPGELTQVRANAENLEAIAHSVGPALLALEQDPTTGSFKPVKEPLDFPAMIKHLKANPPPPEDDLQPDPESQQPDSGQGANANSEPSSSKGNRQARKVVKVEATKKPAKKPEAKKGNADKPAPESAPAPETDATPEATTTTEADLPPIGNLLNQ